ncbi:MULTISPECIES: hypothetical protein [Rheinheimera]|uniref:Uncharacterized protein n=1 Tax=Rheinheimera marina TaxID=1774958 RepID=A0ABV9JLF8_9GAMM
MASLTYTHSSQQLVVAVAGAAGMTFLLFAVMQALLGQQAVPVFRPATEPVSLAWVRPDRPVEQTKRVLPTPPPPAQPPATAQRIGLGGEDPTLVAVVALAYVWQQDSYYQIQTVQQTGYHEVQLHQLSAQKQVTAVPGWQQRYRQYEQARQDLQQQQALLGQLLFEQQQWQVAVCDQLLVKLDQQLAEQLRQDQVWRQGQTVELVRGQQGQILAIRSSAQPLHCAAG